MGSVHYRLTADEKSAVDALNKVMAKQDQVNRKFRETKKTSKSAGDSIQGLAGKMASLAGGISILGSLAGGMRMIERDAKSAAERIGTMTPGRKGLSQIAETMGPGESMVRNLRLRYGFGATGAQEFYTKLSSQGFTDSQITALGGIREIEDQPLPIGMAVGKIQKQYGRGVLGGTIPSVVSALGRAGKASSSTAADIANVALGPLAAGSEVGFKPAEILAATAYATLAGESKEKASTQLEALLIGMMKDPGKRFKGLSFMDALSLLDKMSGSSREQALGGRKEALFGYRLFGEGREGIPGLTASIEQEARIGATEAGYLARKRAMVAKHPELAAQMAYERGTAELEIEQEFDGVRETIQQGILARIKAKGVRERRGDPFFLSRWGSAAAEWMATGALDLMNPTNETMITVGSQLQNRSLSGEGAETRLEQNLREAFGPAIEAAEAMRDAASDLRSVTRDLHTINPDNRSEGY